MLMRIIDDGMSTRLYHRICDQLGLCYDTAAGYQAFDDVGVVEFAADTAHERAGVLLSELLQIADELAQNGPTPAELERARRRCQWQFQAMLDEPEALAHFYAEATLSGLHTSPSERCEALCDASQADLRAAAQTVFQTSMRSVAAVGLQKPKQQDELRKLTQG
jgi:predicted Zn-dependent peptidase